MSSQETETRPTRLRPYTEEWLARRREAIGQAGCTQLGFYAIPDDFLLSVVIPVYNEEATLEQIVERTAAVPIRKEIVLVDDCSTDGSREILRRIEERMARDPETRIRTLLHDENRGKGAALQTGLAHTSGDVVLIQDADLEYDPAEYPRLLQPIILGEADVVYGSRFLGDRPHRVLYFWHYLGNRFLTTLSNCFTNLNLTDMETCYKVFTREVVDQVQPLLRQQRFGFEPEVTAKIARRRFRIYEVSISYFGRTYEEGKKIGWKDGVQALWCILRYGLAD